MALPSCSGSFAVSLVLRALASTPFGEPWERAASGLVPLGELGGSALAVARVVLAGQGGGTQSARAHVEREAHERVVLVLSDGEGDAALDARLGRLEVGFQHGVALFVCEDLAHVLHGQAPCGA